MINAFSFNVSALPVAIPVIFELLQGLLLSAGITFMSYDIIKNIKSNSAYDEGMNLILDYLDSIDSGLGSSLRSDIGGTYVAGDSTVLRVSKENWDRILNMSSSLSSQDTFTFGELDLSVDMNLVSQFISQTLPFIEDSYLPMDSGGKRYRVGDIPDSGSWQSFLDDALSFSGVSSPYLSTFYFAQNYSNQLYGIWNIMCIYTENNVKIHDFKLTDSAGNVKDGVLFGDYLHLLDVSGNEIAYGYVYLHWDITRKCWTIWSRSDNSSGVGTARKLDNFYSTNGKLYRFPCIINGVYKLPVSAKVDDFVKDTVKNGAYDVVTPGRVYTDGLLDGDVTITLPSGYSITDALEGVYAGDKTISDVLLPTKVIPVDKASDKVLEGDKTITDAIADVSVLEVGVGAFDLSLSEFFPFCIPFDFVDFLSVLKAEPQAPTFTFPFFVGIDSDGNFIYQDYVIDLSIFDSVASAVRLMELFAFTVGLILSTRSIFLRS